MALTTLILGAGLGKEYGFPDGPELKKLIANQLEKHDKRLQEILEWSPAETVDAIAARYPEYADQIRQIVTTILWSRESETRVKGGTTYQLMLEQIAAAQIKGDHVKVITFNYDRSLPYLLHKINSISPKERQIDPKIVTPIYGRLGPLYFEDQESRNRPMKHHSYGPKDVIGRAVIEYEDDDENTRNVELAIQAAEDARYLHHRSNVSFIGEAKAPKNPEVAATLKDSDRIFFLGVGYHQANMEVLGFDFRQPHPEKVIAGTGLHLTTHHVEALLQEYPAIKRIENCDGYSFLKTKFDIGDPTRHLLKRPISILDTL